MHILLINRLKKRQELFRKKTVPEKLRSWRILKVVNGICKTCAHTPLDFIYEYPKNKKIEKIAKNFIDRKWSKVYVA